MNYPNTDVPSTVFIQGVPHRGPPAPNIAIRPLVQQFVDSMHWHLIHDIQRYCNADNARKMLYFTASNNSYMNTYYGEEVLGKALEYLEYKMMVEHMQYIQAIPIVSNDICGMSAASFVVNNPGVRSGMSQEQINDYGAWDNLGKRIGAAVYGYITNPANMPMQPGMQMQPNMMMQPGYGYTMPVQGGARGAGGAAFQVPINAMGYSQPMMYGNMNPAGMAYGGGGSMVSPMATMPFNAGSVRRDDPLLSGMSRITSPAQQQPEPIRPQPQQQPQIQPAKVIQEFHMDGDTPENTLVTMEFAKTSKLKMSLNPRDNYHALYDPSEEVAYFEVDGNFVREIIQKKDPSMDYEQHETIGYFKPKIAADINKSREYDTAKRAFMDVVKQKSIDVRIEELEKTTANVETADGSPILIEEPFFMEEEVMGAIGSNAYANVTAQLESSNVPVDMDVTTISFTHIGVDQLCFSGDLAIKMAELMCSRTWDVLHSRMEALQKDMRPLYWYRMHDELTAAVNEYLKYVLNVNPPGVDNLIDSFMDDVLSLPEYLTNKFGAIYADRFENAAEKIAQGVLVTFNGKDEFFKYLHGERTDDNFHVCRGCIESITLLPIHSCNLIMDHAGPAGRIRSDGKYADFYKAVKAIFDRQKAMPVQPRHTKMMTDDGEVLYLYRAAFGQEEFLVRKG